MWEIINRWSNSWITFGVNGPQLILRCNHSCVQCFLPTSLPWFWCFSTDSQFVLSNNIGSIKHFYIIRAVKNKICCVSTETIFLWAMYCGMLYNLCTPSPAHSIYIYILCQVFFCFISQYFSFFNGNTKKYLLCRAINSLLDQHCQNPFCHRYIY